METQYLNTNEAAAYIRSKGLSYSPKTMIKERCVGGGCVYRKFGRKVVYTRLDLDAFIEARLSEPKSNTAA